VPEAARIAREGLIEVIKQLCGVGQRGLGQIEPAGPGGHHRQKGRRRDGSGGVLARFARRQGSLHGACVAGWEREKAVSVELPIAGVCVSAIDERHKVGRHCHEIRPTENGDRFLSEMHHRSRPFGRSIATIAGDEPLKLLVQLVEIADCESRHPIHRTNSIGVDGRRVVGPTQRAE
jgi:hypothetical protein